MKLHYDNQNILKGYYILPVPPKERRQPLNLFKQVSIFTDKSLYKWYDHTLFKNTGCG